MQKLFKIRIKSGDTVMVRSGKYKGRTGKVLSVNPKENKLRVEGVNVVKRHLKPSQARPQGGVVELTKPIWVSKVGLLDNSAKKPSRVGYKIDAKGNKSRY
ncbi:MAG TPA: 50S ribosomal protein L24, partial [Candidatus Saccharimonadales bacterium]|nr:50S ribosomal protein L24 [Candidatus Saccharimonadales bacterium]